MKTLIVEDDVTSQLLLQEILKPYGLVHIAVDGREAVESVRLAFDDGVPYDLICLDIMMPGMDGQQALREIRAIEEARGGPEDASRIVMTTALSDAQNIMTAYGNQCDGYLIKPYQKARLLDELRKLGLSL